MYVKYFSGYDYIMKGLFWPMIFLLFHVIPMLHQNAPPQFFILMCARAKQS